MEAQEPSSILCSCGLTVVGSAGCRRAEVALCFKGCQLGVQVCRCREINKDQNAAGLVVLIPAGFDLEFLDSPSSLQPSCHFISFKCTLNCKLVVKNKQKVSKRTLTQTALSVPQDRLK